MSGKAKGNEAGSKRGDQIVAIGAPVPGSCAKPTNEKGVSLEPQDRDDKPGLKVQAKEGSMDEKSDMGRKKKKLEKVRTRRNRRRVAREQVIVSGEMVGASKSSMAIVPLDIKAGDAKASKQGRNTESRLGKQGEFQSKPRLSGKILKARSLMLHNSEVAATGLWGYIAIDPDYLEKGTINEWVDAAAGAFIDSKRAPKYMSYLSAPSAKSNGEGKKAKKIPSLVACFQTTNEREKALGHISIMGFKTKMVRFRGPKARTFKIPPGFCFPNGEKMCRAFEEQAMVKLEAWGWRQFMGIKSDFVLQCQLPPRREPDAIEVDGWRLECISVEEGECCCCGEAHNCFASDVECKRFALGHKLWYV